ncbi:hypothetical protein DesfrDRAFT_0831 [Solidesulfovibrio fructosivorans JJ]]|uniref:DUF2628 domain-containing protein n=1 Tax=Solidesulfovibrio fructosivorans JJ] TaxID=596151 RepID=E1JT82_SOLFR|nr:DUF2628 domain-containing protein [Solidesulfovibrio fructosivorans]EFL52342.1 hypothetical protein DesfrDRAFT_0831 [Solidesulfovibrio fructosivorans JJ]]
MTDALNQMSDKYCSEAANLFVGKNSSYFIPIFARFSKLEKQSLHNFFGKFISFNWSAFLVTFIGPFPFYFIYRKMWGVSIVFFILCKICTTLIIARIFPLAGYSYLVVYSMISLCFSNYLYYLRFKKNTLKLKKDATKKSSCGVSYFAPVVAILVYLLFSICVDFYLIKFKIISTS